MKYFEKLARKDENDIRNLVAGFLAGTTSAAFLNPIDVYNTRLKNFGKVKAKEYLKELNINKHGIKKVLKSATIGLKSKAFKVGAGAALTFATYDRYKKLLGAKSD